MSNNFRQIKSMDDASRTIVVSKYSERWATELIRAFGARTNKKALENGDSVITVDPGLTGWPALRNSLERGLSPEMTKTSDDDLRARMKELGSELSRVTKEARRRGIVAEAGRQVTDSMIYLELSNNGCDFNAAFKKLYPRNNGNISGSAITRFKRIINEYGINTSKDAQVQD